MMQRISTRASNDLSLSYVYDINRRMRDLEAQIATGKIAQDYGGVGGETRRLLDMETTRTALDQFASNNDAVAGRLEALQTTLTGIDKTIADFRNELLTLGNSDPISPVNVENMQELAFQSLRSLEVFLNTDYDGQFLFAGGRKTTQPVDLGLSSLQDFQSVYDGDTVVYPPTRDAHVERSVTLGNAEHGGLQFIAPDTIQATTAGGLASLPVGATIEVNGTTLNEGSYTVVENLGTIIRIAGTLTAGPAAIPVNGTVAPEGVIANATISTGHWYAGDRQVQNHRVSEDRTIQAGILAIDPAFEKAIRAMGLIAQGADGTPGGLAQHPERVEQAIALLSLSLDRAADDTLPFGAEAAGTTESVRRTVGFEQEVVHNTSERQRTFIAIMEGTVADIEDVDPTYAISALLDQTRALEASYETISRVRQLSLNNYL